MRGTLWTCRTDTHRSLMWKNFSHFQKAQWKARACPWAVLIPSGRPAPAFYGLFLGRSGVMLVSMFAGADSVCFGNVSLVHLFLLTPPHTSSCIHALFFSPSLPLFFFSHSSFENTRSRFLQEIERMEGAKNLGEHWTVLPTRTPAHNYE